METYVLKEQTKISNIVIAFTVSFLWTAFSSFIYGVLVAVIPFVYFNIFICGAFGLSIGYGVRVSAKLFVVTDKKISIINSIINGILGVYLSWVVYLIFLSSGSSLLTELVNSSFLFFKPGLVYQIISDINVYGAWGMFGAAINGTLLTIIWIMEAVIIVIISYFFLKKTPVFPFSSSLNKWYKKYSLSKDFESISMQKDFVNRLQSDCKTVISELEGGLAYHYATISIFYLENEETQYLTVENIRKDREGKSKNTVVVVHLLKITTSEAEDLIKKFHGKRSVFF